MKRIVGGTFRVSGPLSISCEVVIIGSGAGGSTAAQILTEAGKDVLMLEEGKAIFDDTVPESSAIGVSKMWRNGGLNVALGKTPVAYAEGKCVGGGTEINSAIMQRTPGELLNLWAKEYNIDDFGEEELSTYYDTVLKQVNSSLHTPPYGMVSNVFYEAVKRKNWKIIGLERAQKDCVATNMCSSGCPTTGKQSMTNSILKSALDQGLRLISECKVEKLIHYNGEVTKVIAKAIDADGNAHKVKVLCKRAVASAGAIYTPNLLLKSGIKKNIGRSLRLHPTIKILAKFPFVMKAYNDRLPLYAVTEFMPNIRLGGSIFTPGFFGMSLAENWQTRAHLMSEMDNCAIYYAMVRAEGRGSIYPMPIFTNLSPLVTYSLTHNDYLMLKKGICYLSELMLEMGATELHPSLNGDIVWHNIDEVNKSLDNNKIKRANLMTIHIFGSCPMGENHRLCAVNSFGQVHDMSNLFIADASIIPEAPGVNPQATIMAITRRNVLKWLSQWDNN